MNDIILILGSSREEFFLDPRQRCTATTKHGTRCQKRALTASDVEQIVANAWTDQVVDRMLSLTCLWHASRAARLVDA